MKRIIHQVVIRLGLFLISLGYFNLAEADYILRYTTTGNGGIIFTGNTLGLSKASGKLQPGTQHSIGAFITTDTTQQVGMYPPGTTAEWEKNSSLAYLDLPEGSSVLYAELIWSGSFGTDGKVTVNTLDTPISFTLPEGSTFSVMSDPATRFPVGKTKGYYTRSANVTSFVQAGGKGPYIVGGVPASILASEDTSNAAGWTLAVVFTNGNMVSSNSTIFVANEYVSSSTSNPAAVSGFCAPPSGVKAAQIFVSALEGDQSLKGDQFLFGPELPLTTDNALSGSNNPINNFFCAQINTLHPNTTDTIPGKQTMSSGSGTLDTRGSFGNFNGNAQTGKELSGGRQGYDITSVDGSDFIEYGQTFAYAQGSTNGDKYLINALGIQIQVGAPIITMDERVNNALITTANIGAELPIVCTLVNKGTNDAIETLFRSRIPNGLEYVVGSVYVNGVSRPAFNPVVGFTIDTLEVEQTITISYRVKVINYPAEGSVFPTSSFLDYQFETCQSEKVSSVSESNLVEIELVARDVPVLIMDAFVNGEKAIETSVGERVKFLLILENVGNEDALNVNVIDFLPQELSIDLSSVVINTLLNPGNPLVGVTAGTILKGDKVYAEFDAIVNTPPLDGGNYYFNDATANYQYLNNKRNFITLSVDSPTLQLNLRAPPSGFEGTVTKCQALNKTMYCLSTQWPVPRSAGVVGYRIYDGDTILSEVPVASDQDLTTYNACLTSPDRLSQYRIVALYSATKRSDEKIESASVPLKIIPR